MINTKLQPLLASVIFPVLIVLSIVLLTPAVTAATPSQNEGRLLASNCFGCHGTNGRPAGGFDRLAGESVSEITEEMREMKSEDKGIMSKHALGYTDEQVRLIAVWFSNQ
jgi:cytochrome c553